MASDEEHAENDLQRSECPFVGDPWDERGKNDRRQGCRRVLEREVSVRHVAVDDGLAVLVERPDVEPCRDREERRGAEDQDARAGCESPARGHALLSVRGARRLFVPRAHLLLEQRNPLRELDVLVGELRDARSSSGGGRAG